jgi:hypothetical protein
MRSPRSDFRQDRDESSAAPHIHEPLDDKPKPSRWYGGKRRTFPQQPKGAYLQILNDLIAESHRKGTPAPPNCDDAYWDERRKNEDEKQLPLSKAA